MMGGHGASCRDDGSNLNDRGGKGQWPKGKDITRLGYKKIMTV